VSVIRTQRMRDLSPFDARVNTVLIGILGIARISVPHKNRPRERRNFP
jgi:hypothetical protein